MKVRVTITGFVELPDSEQHRRELYGTINPAACVAIDFDNDAASFLLDQVDEMTLATEVIS